MKKLNYTSRRSSRHAMLAVAALLVASLACINIPLEFQEPTPELRVATPQPGAEATQIVIPTLTPGVIGPTVQPVTPVSPADTEGEDFIPDTGSAILVSLFEQLNPGVVSIQIYTGQSMQPAGVGSGFILDQDGHIVTNRHVVANAPLTTVVFYNGYEASAEIIGVDDDSDLAVLKVEDLPADVFPLPLGDSDNVRVGEQVMAIGNPFGLASSMTWGIVSALGRNIPTEVTSFSIPQAIQTDAAINPGNSGGPLLNMRGEIIGVNAQIATRGGTPGNVGVGFAIPSNIVRRVAPVLIESGTYHWPWLGIEGTGVNLALMSSNNLPDQQGTYVHRVVENSPAQRAGLRGTDRRVNVNGLSGVFAGGDVIRAADGEAILDLGDLLVAIADHLPGETMQLIILRDGQEIQVDVQLEARPATVGEPDQIP